MKTTTTSFFVLLADVCCLFFPFGVTVVVDFLHLFFTPGAGSATGGPSNVVSRLRAERQNVRGCLFPIFKKKTVLDAEGRVSVDFNYS